MRSAQRHKDVELTADPKARMQLGNLDIPSPVEEEVPQAGDKQLVANQARQRRLNQTTRERINRTTIFERLSAQVQDDLQTFLDSMMKKSEKLQSLRADLLAPNNPFPDENSNELGAYLQQRPVSQTKDHGFALPVEQTDKDCSLTPRTVGEIDTLLRTIQSHHGKLATIQSKAEFEGNWESPLG